MDEIKEQYFCFFICFLDKLMLQVNNFVLPSQTGTRLIKTNDNRVVQEIKV